MTKPFEDFLTGLDPETDDVSAALAAAAAWSAANEAPVVIAGSYWLENVAVLDDEGATLLGIGATFKILDTGTKANPKYSGFADMPCGLHVTADNVSLRGDFTLKGWGLDMDTNKMCGLFVDEVDGFVADHINCEDMAAGAVLSCCTNPEIAKFTGNNFKGQQFGSTDGSGDGLVLGGCYNPVVRSIRLTGVDKCGVYLSVGVHSSAVNRDNTDGLIGPIYVVGRSGTPWASGLGLRSCKNITFEGVTAVGVGRVAGAEKYSGDTWNIDNVHIGYVTGQVIDTASATDIGFIVNQEASSGTMGSITVDSIDVTGPTDTTGQIGIYVVCGDVRIGRAIVNGFNLSVRAYNTTLHVDHLIVNGPAYNALEYGKGLKGAIGRFDIVKGPVGGSAPAGMLFAESAYNSGGATPDFEIGRLRYRRNGSAQNANYILYDTTLCDPNQFRICDYQGDATSGNAYLQGVYKGTSGNVSVRWTSQGLGTAAATPGWPGTWGEYRFNAIPQAGTGDQQARGWLWDENLGNWRRDSSVI